MNWPHFLAAVIVSAIAGSLGDWLFAGVLFHDRYLAYPEVWRPNLRQNDAGPIAWSMTLGLLTFIAFMATCIIFNIHGYRFDLEFAALLWLMVPLPLTITNALFIKIHPLIVVSLAWLARKTRSRRSYSLLAARLIAIPAENILAYHYLQLCLDTHIETCMIMQADEYSRIRRD
jgi:hypothetical protein